MPCSSEDCLGEGEGRLPCLEAEPASSCFDFLCFLDGVSEQEWIRTERVGDWNRGHLDSKAGATDTALFGRPGAFLGVRTAWTYQMDSGLKWVSSIGTNRVDQLRERSSKQGNDLDGTASNKSFSHNVAFSQDALSEYGRDTLTQAPTLSPRQMIQTHVCHCDSSWSCTLWIFQRMS